MKYLVLEYMKNMNFASYDLNTGHMAKDVVIVDAKSQQSFTSLDSYLNAKRSKLEGLQFEVLRCDDFDDIAIVLAQVNRNEVACFDYIGYFKTDETVIHRIDEYWCERNQ